MSDQPDKPTQAPAPEPPPLPEPKRPDPGEPETRGRNPGERMVPERLPERHNFRRGR